MARATVRGGGGGGRQHAGGQRAAGLQSLARAEPDWTGLGRPAGAAVELVLGCSSEGNIAVEDPERSRKLSLPKAQRSFLLSISD